MGALCEAEVEQDDLAARRELQVLRLDVAVHDRRVLGVQVVERVEQAVGPAEDLLDGKSPAARLEQRREVASRDELHHQELVGVDAEVVHHHGERRMA